MMGSMVIYAMQGIELTEEERKAMGVNSRKKVEQYFDEEIVLNKYLNAISELKS